MNDRHVRRQVLDAIQKERVIANGNVIGTLLGKAKVAGTSGRDAVLDALDTLQRSNHIGVVKNPDDSISRVYLKQPKLGQTTAVDRFDRSTEAKRQDTYARGVPSVLPDSMCSPVTIIKREDRQLPTPNDMPAKIQPTDKESEKVTTAKLTILEEINHAWTGLKCRANETTGVLPVGSVHAFIMEDLKEYGVTANRATYLNQTLAKLGLRKTVNLGFPPKGSDEPRKPRFQSSIVVSVSEISQEMFDSLKATSEQVQVNDEDVEIVQTVSEDLGRTTPSPDTVTVGLVKIIKGLEEKNEKLQKAYQDEVDKNLGLTNELETEQTLNSKLRAQIAGLKAAPVDPEVLSLLEKYQM